MDTHIILAIAAMAGYGVTAVIYKVASKSIDSVSLAFFVSLFITTTISVFWLFTKEKHITFEGIGYAGLAGIIAALAFIAFIASIQMGKVSVSSTLRGLSFVVTTIIAILFLAEKITLLKILGIVFAAVAVILLAT